MSKKEASLFPLGVCVLTRQQQEGRFLWALKCNVVAREWVGVVAGR